MSHPNQGDLLAEPRAHARKTDPSTSHEAAETVNISETKRRILMLLRTFGPMTDEQIAERYRDTFTASKLTDQRLRTARSDLEKRRLVSHVTDRWGVTSHGGKCRIWRATI